jgi:hypothetical protein
MIQTNFRRYLFDYFVFFIYDPNVLDRIVSKIIVRDANDWWTNTIGEGRSSTHNSYTAILLTHIENYTGKDASDARSPITT